jgi:hypothetical protein
MDEDTGNNVSKWHYILFNSIKESKKPIASMKWTRMRLMDFLNWRETMIWYNTISLYGMQFIGLKYKEFLFKIFHISLVNQTTH